MSDYELVRNKPQPTLEQEISAIDELDRLRTRADELRRTGIEQLRKIVIGEADHQEIERWMAESDEPQELVQPALLCLAATREFLRDDDKYKEFRGKQLERLSAAQTKHFFEANNPEWRLPTFQAARVLQACLASPEGTFSRPSMLAYYAVVRELGTVDDSKGYGAARAAEGGLPCAFMTGECARAISAMARALEGSADAIDAVLIAIKEWANVTAFSKRVDKMLFGDWTKVETKRIALFAYSTIASAARKAAIRLTNADFGIHLSVSLSTEIPAKHPIYMRCCYAAVLV